MFAQGAIAVIAAIAAVVPTTVQAAPADGLETRAATPYQEYCPSHDGKSIGIEGHWFKVLCGTDMNLGNDTFDLAASTPDVCASQCLHQEEKCVGATWRAGFNRCYGKSAPYTFTFPGTELVTLLFVS